MTTQIERDGPAVSVRLVAGGDAADAAYAVLDVRAPAGARLPPHVCSRADGALLVLHGEVEVVLGARREVIGAGEVLAVPRARPRRIQALRDVRILCLCIPAGLERLAGVLAEPDLEPDDLAAMLAAAGVALLPPGWGAAPATV